MLAPSTNPLQRGCHEGLAVNTIAMPLDQANGSTMVMFFFRVGPFLQSALFYLGAKGMCEKTMFLHFVPVDGVEYFSGICWRERYVFVFLPGGNNFFWLPSPSKINLEEPVRVASPTRINLEEPISSGYPAQTGLTWKNLSGWSAQPGLTWRNQFLLVTQPKQD